MAVLTEKLPHRGGHIITELDPDLCRETVTIAAGTLGPGTVLGQVTIGAVTVAADAGNTGTGTLTPADPPVGPAVKTGDYLLACDLAPTSGDVVFSVLDPSGGRLGDATVGSAYANDHLAFTIVQGTAADFVFGDNLTVSVAPGSGQYVQFDPDAADGSQIASAILFGDADAASAPVAAAVTARLTTVTKAELTWPAGITDGEKAAALASLADRTIIAR